MRPYVSKAAGMSIFSITEIEVAKHLEQRQTDLGIDMVDRSLSLCVKTGPVKHI